LALDFGERRNGLTAGFALRGACSEGKRLRSNSHLAHTKNSG